jgi:hypothetical protein
VVVVVCGKKERQGLVRSGKEAAETGQPNERKVAGNGGGDQRKRRKTNTDPLRGEQAEGCIFTARSLAPAAVSMKGGRNARLRCKDRKVDCIPSRRVVRFERVEGVLDAETGTNADAEGLRADGGCKTGSVSCRYRRKRSAKGETGKRENGER